LSRSKLADRVECIVIGAGVVGLAVAAKLAQAGLEVIVLERHDLIGSETSSRNSEVIHAGIYYPEESLKAELCVRGKHMLYEYCEHHSIPHKRCGKLIVAATEDQAAQVQAFIAKGAANGVADLKWLSQAAVSELEPEVACVGAVVSPSTGILDSHAFMLSLQGQLEHAGGVIAFNTEVKRVLQSPPGARVETADFTLEADWTVNCAGLSAPALARDMPDTPQAYFAKGHYYAYSGRQPFTRLVYPVPEPGGLGVHVTLDLAGQIKFGPDVHWLERVDYSFDETIKDGFANAIRQYYPALDETRMHPSYTGIRPKIAPPTVGFQDFRIEGPRAHGVAGRVNLFGIESPGLTASLAIAERVAQQMGL
jgi:L-2-hydroxyglutarate oxidase LhgO